MEKKHLTTPKTALNFGILLGGISVIFGVMLYVLDMHYQNDTSTSIISYVFLIVIILWGIVHFRKENNGYLTLSDALKTGMGIALISSIITAT